MQALEAINWGSLPDWGMLAVAAIAAFIGLRQLKAAIEATKVAREAARSQAQTAADAAKQQAKESADEAQRQAVASAAAAQVQLKIAADAAQHQAQIARASLILEIDRDFESDEMQECRLALRALHNELKAFSERIKRHANKDQRNAHINELFGDYLNKLWADFKKSDRRVTENSIDQLMALHLDKIDENPREIQPHERAGGHYQRLTRIFGWLERVAFMVHRGLLPKDDIIKLYDEVFVQIVGWMFEHIRTRREDSGNMDYLIETTKMRDLILKERAERQKALDDQQTPDGKGVF